jgi:23S rRNA A2030 N6-methylase RlmJ
LIDPPYEEREDFESVAAACQEALRRLRSAVIAAWYPIKDVRTTSAWLARLASRIDCENRCLNGGSIRAIRACR